MPHKRVRRCIQHIMPARSELTQSQLGDNLGQLVIGVLGVVVQPGHVDRNNVRLLLLMDVGGTMDPYYEPVSRLLTALHEQRGLRDFKSYYFHNCIYERLGTFLSI